MSENVDRDFTGAEITDEDISEFIEHGGGELPTYHPILQVWREVLKPAREEATTKVTPAWANRIVSCYLELTFADMNDFRDSYFGKLFRLMEILDEEIATDDECLNYTSPEEDVEHNSGHYRQLITDWQKQLLTWEMGWQCTDPDAAIQLAALAEVQKQIFGDTGITAFLDNIKFQFTDEDQARLREELETLKGGSGE